jgi:putative membrane protein
MWGCNTLFGFSGMGGFHPWGGIFHLLFWGALILFIIWAVKRVTQQASSHAAPVGNEAASILDNRFARGDLSAEEYREAKRTLSSN